MTDGGTSMTRNALTEEARRIVVKLGTAVLVNENGSIALSKFHSFIESLAKIKQKGREVMVVSSGAVGLGAERLHHIEPKQLISMKQACAAVGQGKLMALYSDGFERFGITIAQLLLTEEDFSNRKRYLNLKSTITKLLELGVVPIINENDTVSTSELEEVDETSFKKVNFGDNDRLSALVASKMEADLLLILTDVEGLYADDPKSSANVPLIPTVEKITPEIEKLASGKSKLGRGGMKTKLEAAQIATQSGCGVIIASGRIPTVIDRIFAQEDLGTFFVPHARLPGKRRWIAFATSINAALVVNKGAREAIVERQASLLAAGVLEVRGKFERGDVVSVLDEHEEEFARGIVNYSSSEVQRISGMHSHKMNELIKNKNYDALIKRDNMALLGKSK